MNPAPTIDTAQKELSTAEATINFNSPEWKAIEIWLGWKRYRLSLSILAEPDSEQRAELHGQAKMCKELIILGESKRK